MDLVTFGCAGLGGFAGAICDRLLSHSQVAKPKIRLIAACDPDPERNLQRVAALNAAGVTVHCDFEQLLADQIEAVWLPLPIDLHRPFTERALAAGKAVMVEKPAAGCVDDVDAMIAARDRSGLQVTVGFQDVYQPPMLALKQRLLSGEFGKPTSATLVACWPRGERYYRRNTWAGKMRHNGTWILDSPASNAIAHYIHLVMFLLGPAMDQAAPLQSIQAELYRANPIENYDTCSVRIIFKCGADFVFALTHACAETLEPEIQIHTDHGVTINLLGSKTIEIKSGESIETTTLEGSRYANVIGAFARKLRKQRGAPAGGTLEMARAHIVAVNGASESSPIHEIPAGFVDNGFAKDESPVRAVRDIVATLRESVRRRELLHETGLAKWSKPAPPPRDLTDYRHFAGPCDAGS